MTISLKCSIALLAILSSATGCAGSIATGDPQWVPPILSKEGCPDIDGKYLGNNLLIRQFLADTPAGVEPLWSKKTYREIPLTTLDEKDYAALGIDGDQARRTAMAKDWAAQRRQFYSHAITEIVKNGRVIEVLVMDASGLEFEKGFITLDHPYVGCNSGALVIRNFQIAQGGEGTSGTAYAGESEIRKLGNGDLQVIGRSREWSKTMNSDPRRSGATLIFPVVR
jgi:hypothetical protein